MSNLAIIQPNEMTNAKYDFTALQKNIVYTIYGELQRYMTKESEINKDLFDNFVVSVPVDAFAGEKNHTKVIDAVKDLMTKPLEYQYSREKRKYTVATVLVHTATHEHGSKTVDLTIPVAALSLLLYIGKGFTQYQMPIALALKSKHSKRIYELCCRWKDKGGFNMELDEFKQMLGVEKQYRNINMLRDRVLAVAKEELKEGADVWFEFELKKIKSRSFNWVYFTIFANDLKQKTSDRGTYPSVYNFLLISFPNMFSDKALRIADQLYDQGKIALAWSKFRPIYENKELDSKHIENITKKILREDFKIKVD